VSLHSLITGIAVRLSEQADADVKRVELAITGPVCCRCNQGKVNFREKEKQVLDQILGPGRYDARIRPSGINGTGEGHHLNTRLCLRDAPRQKKKNQNFATSFLSSEIAIYRMSQRSLCISEWKEKWN
jgi:hypothetical protein